MNNFASFIVPSVVSLIVIFALIKRVSIFDVFLVGAKEGFNSTISILPSLVGLITAVSMLRLSGALDLFCKSFEPVANFLSIPSEVLPLLILKPISGGGSLAFVDSIFQNFGPDSFVGRIASVMMGATETTFYTIAVYFGSVGIKNTKYVVPASLLADIGGFLMSILVVKYIFYG